MIRVLNVISGLNNAGTEAVVMNYYRNIDRTKVQFDFLVLDEAENLYYEEEINRLGGRIYKLPPFKKNPVKSIFGRRKFFKKHKYEIVEVHAPSATRYAFCKSAKNSGAKKVIFHIHSSCYDNGPLIRYARKQLKKHCDEIVTCSQLAAESILGEKADKVVCNAIDYSKYRFDKIKRDAIRKNYGINESTKVIGHVGRFSLPKNHLFLLEAFALVARENDAIVLLLKGFGELKTEIANKIKELNIQDKVIFADEYDANELFNAFDLFVLPSLYEGFPVVLVEAQANGLKCLISDNVTKEADLSGENKFVQLDIAKWAQTIELASFERLPSDFDFSATGYDIREAAKKRQNEYLNLEL